MSTIRTAGNNTIQGISIIPRFSPSTVRRASYFNYTMGAYVVDIAIGVINNDTPGVVDRRTVTVPRQRLLNGIAFENIRTIRFNHLLNILSSYADEILNVDLDHNTVVFLGFESSNA